MSNPTPRQFQPVLAALMSVLAAAGAAAAQPVSSCQDPVPPSIGFALGRSSPYVDLARDAVDSETGSVLVYGGSQFTGRADVSPGGLFRVRLEASTARWAVQRKIYDPNAGYREVANISEGHIAARSVGAAAGLRLGRPAVCAHILVGGGVHVLDYHGAGLTAPGFWIVAGLEIPTGSRGVVQIDTQLQMIQTGGRYPIAFSTVLAVSLTAGWAFRFR